MSFGAGARLIVVLAFIGCGHVIHPAAVTPGFSLEVLPAIELPAHAPLPATSQSNSDRGYQMPGPFAPYTSVDPGIQVGVGYGFRMNRHLAVQGRLNVGTLAVLDFDLYAQLLGAPFDFGVGLYAAAGAKPSPYVMLGKAFELGGGARLRVDGGSRLILRDEPSYGDDSGATRRHVAPMLLLSHERGRQAFGVWADAVFYGHPIYYRFCDETCHKDDLATRMITVGFYYRYSTR